MDKQKFVWNQWQVLAKLGFVERASEFFPLYWVRVGEAGRLSRSGHLQVRQEAGRWRCAPN